ncbi:tetratricopeptide repeat protein [Bdellovibrio sp. HCB2-146]|uniref:tetratricopeptide repeat protein n=1 Tax=Bdellovibrio sp. HCB2-146 TaxID=3394362 RepID=UPI0039BC622D
MLLNGFMVLALSAGTVVHAQTEGSGTTQDLLIQKLTQVQMNLAPADPARAAVLMRLGDLHAERARQATVKEMGEGCTVCEAGKKDREKALSYYTEALAKIPTNASSKVLLQMGHILEVQGDAVKAEKNYESVLLSSNSPLEKAEAYLSLAEMAFRKSDYKKAQSLYEKVLATEGAGSQGLAAYRRAWCSFRLGEMEMALSQLQQILQNPKLQSRAALSRGAADMQFLEEVSHDLVTFMASRGIKEGDAETLYNLTPQAFKLQQVTLLAREGLRLDQKEMDLKVWDFVYQKQTDPKARLEAQVRIAQLNFDLKRMEPASKAYTMALNLWGGTGCDKTSCEDSFKGLRNFVIGWNRIEATKASPGLIAAYDDYLKVFSQDEDMFVWAAQAAAQVENYSQSAQWTAQANGLMLAHYQTEKDASAKKTLADKLEKNLLLGIEVAEKSKNEKLLISAQDDYLQQSVLHTKTLDVQYQKAYAVYQKADYAAAADQLKALAMMNEGSQQIRIQAADLALDAVGLLKDDTRLQQWASEFAVKFPSKKADFQSVQQKSILAQSAKLAEKQPDQALAVLAGFIPAEASAEDRKVYLKNKVLLSEKLNRITEARVAVEDLLRENNLTPDEREFALGRKMWFAELELDFASALKAAEQMKFAGLSQDEKVLKLALYTELAEKDPQGYYQQYLKESKDAEKKALIAAQLVRISKNPIKDLETYKPYMKSNPGLYARTVMTVYIASQDRKVLEKAVKERGSNKQDAYVMAERILILEDLKALSTNLSTHQVDGKNQKVMAATLKARVSMLDKMDALTNRAIALGDWTSQLMTLDLVAKENQRFYNEVLSLPMPAGLSPEQEQEYLMLLSQQVAPNQNKAQMAEIKVKEFWSQKSALDNYRQFANQNSEWIAVISKEVSSIAAIAPDDHKPNWTALAGDLQKITPAGQERPTLAEMEKARLNLKQNPFAPAAIQDVIALEKKAQRQSMVDYLESRLATVAKKDSETKEKQQ